MCELRRLVEREVRWRDHGDGCGACLGGVRGEGDRVRSRLRTAVGGDGQPTARRLEEQLEPAPALVWREEDALAVRPEGQQSVDACRSQVIDERAEGLRVER